MIRLLRFLIWGDAHLHKWRLHEEPKVRDPGTGAVWAFDKHCRCEVCGRFRKFRL